MRSHMSAIESTSVPVEASSQPKKRSCGLRSVGVGIHLSVDQLQELGIDAEEADRIEYWVEDGQLVLEEE